MEAKVTMKDEYRNQELIRVAKYNSFYDIYYRADKDTDTFGFVLVDKEKSLQNTGKFYLMQYKQGKFVFGKMCGLFLPNIECIYPFIKKADIRINNIGLAHIINLKKNRLIK